MTQLLQKTIAKPFTLEGIGIHSGQPSKLFFSPAPSNSGIVFIKGSQRIPALVNNVTSTLRGTSLPGINVIEHLLSALSALGISNLEITVEGDELPILDGSSIGYLSALENNGLQLQEAVEQPLILTKALKIEEADTSLEALPYAGFKLNFMINFSPIGKQFFIFDPDKDSYKQEIAPARTFGYLSDMDILKKQGLGLGASLDNALALDKNGYVNQPRFPDEMVRHKILDLIGDLALLGRPLRAEIRAVKSGHKLNTALIRRILENV